MRPKVVRRHVLAVDQLVRDLRPVDLEIVVGEQRVVLLARLLLDALQLVERMLARLLEEPRLELLGDVDREHAEVTLVVELHGGVPRRARRLLVSRQQRVLESCDKRAALDSLLAFDLANGVNDFLAHPVLPFVNQICPDDFLVRDVHRRCVL